MREVFNFLNFGKKEKGNIEVSKIFDFGNLKKNIEYKNGDIKTKNMAERNRVGKNVGLVQGLILQHVYLKPLCAYLICVKTLVRIWRDNRFDPTVQHWLTRMLIGIGPALHTYIHTYRQKNIHFHLTKVKKRQKNSKHTELHACFVIKENEREWMHTYENSTYVKNWPTRMLWYYAVAKVVFFWRTGGESNPHPLNLRTSSLFDLWYS